MDPSRRRSAFVTKANIGFWCLFLGAAVLYLFRLGTLAFTTDEIYHGIVAKAILETGKPILPNGALYLKGVLFSYPGALFSYLFGSVEFGVRFTSAACLLLTGVVVHRLTTALLDARAGLLASFVWFFHPWTIEFARWGRLYTLAALLFTSALYFLFRLESFNRRSDLWIACAFLLVATFVYPLCIWGFFVLAVYAVVRAFQNRSLPKRKVVQFLAAALVLAAVLLAALVGFRDVLVAVLERHFSSSIGAFTGFTGDHSGFKIKQFVSFSPFYVTFFFTDLVVFALSLVALTVRATVARGTASNVRRNVVLVSTTLGALLFVTFFHLQAGAPRYLFAIFPSTVVASVYLWGSVIEERFSDKGRHAYALLFALALVGFTFTGSFEIPFKKHGDRYENANFGPSPVRRKYSDFRSAALFVKNNASSDDLLITDKSQFFYFYAGREADYVLKFGKKPKPRQLATYMSKTREINCAQLAKTLDGNTLGTTWLSLYVDSKVEKCVRKVSKKHRVELLHQDADDSKSKVYRVAARHS